MSLFRRQIISGQECVSSIITLRQTSVWISSLKWDLNCKRRMYGAIPNRENARKGRLEVLVVESSSFCVYNIYKMNEVVLHGGCWNQASRQVLHRTGLRDASLRGSIIRFLRIARNGVYTAEITQIDKGYVRVDIIGVSGTGHTYLYLLSLT